MALITGWDIEFELETPDAYGIEWFFQKPLNVRDLIEKLRQAPGSPAQAADLS